MISKTGINSVSNLKDMVQEIEEKREEFIVIDRIVKLINRISQTEESYNILLVIDEIDKQDEKIIDELIDYYKNLFFNTSIITFFVVDTLQYIKINSGNLLESKMLNYIIKSIYIPTLNRSELRDYLYREFNVNNYEQMVIINYLTQGIFRKVNVYKYLNAYKDRDIFNKAYIYDLLIKELETIDIPLYIRDLLYILIKDIIEELFIYGKIKFSDIEKSFNESKNKYLYKYNLNKILTPIKKVFKEISMLSYICLSTEDILFILKDNIKYEIRREYENKKIQYDIKDNLHSINSTINKSEPIFIKISNNQPEDYSYIIRLIETFSTEIVNLYFIKKITNFNEYEAEAYSIGIEVKKEIGQVMYVIEDFSFSYEDYYAVKGLVKYFEKLQINIPCIEMDDEPIEENIDYIRNKLEKRIYGECQ